MKRTKNYLAAALVALAVCLSGVGDSAATRGFTDFTTTLTANASATPNDIINPGRTCLPPFPYDAVDIDVRDNGGGGGSGLSGGTVVAVGLVVENNVLAFVDISIGGTVVDCTDAEDPCTEPVTERPTGLVLICAEMRGGGAGIGVDVTLSGR